MPRYARNLVIALLLLAVLYALDYFVFDPGRRMISPYVARIIMLAGINITLAVSLNLINGFTGQFSIGHAGFMAVGAYSSAYFSVSYGKGMAESLGDGMVGWLVALLLATLLGALDRGRRGLPRRRAVAPAQGRLPRHRHARLRADHRRLPQQHRGRRRRARLLGIPIVKSFFWIALVAVLTIVVVHNLVHSAIGRALVSIREDELASEAMGVNTTRYKVMAFVIWSALAGAGGVLLAHFDGYLNPKSFEFIKSFRNPHHDHPRRAGLHRRLRPRGHRADGPARGAARVRAVPHGHLLRPAHHPDDHATQRPARRARPVQGLARAQPRQDAHRGRGGHGRGHARQGLGR